MFHGHPTVAIETPCWTDVVVFSGLVEDDAIRNNPEEFERVNRDDY